MPMSALPAVARARRQVLWGLMTLALAMPLLGIAWCRTVTPVEPALASSTGEMSTARVERRAHVEERLLLTGEVSAVRSTKIVVPRTNTWRVQIMWLAEDGAELQAGAPVVELDNTSVVQSIDEKRLRVRDGEVALETRMNTLDALRQKKRWDVARARIEVEKARLDADVPMELRPRREWNQMQSTLQEKEVALAVAERELAQAEAADRAEIENLRMGLEKTRRELATAESAIEQLSVRAPRGGIVIIEDYWQRWLEDRKYQVGDVLYPGLVVASMPDLSEMEVAAWLPDVDDGKVTAGMPARCTLDTYPDRVFLGTVASVGVVAQDRGDASSFSVRIALEEADPERLRPGMSVRVEIIRRTWRDALVVPRAALEWHTGGEAQVRLPGGGRGAVELAGCTPMECIVESGLEEGVDVAL